MVASALYQVHAVDKKCYGPQCYRWAFLLNAASCFFGAGAAGIPPKGTKERNKKKKKQKETQICLVGF
jgi:hypothetical protein